MRPRRRLADVLVLTVLCWALFVPGAHAYIDAGSTSVIFQAVVAGLAAAWMFVKVFWHRVRRLFSRTEDDTAGEPSHAGLDESDAGREVR